MATRSLWPEPTTHDPRYPARVRVIEVGPRDGLQNIAATVPTEVKVQFIDMLSQAGLPEIEVTSFVSPRAIAQLADASEVYTAIRLRQGIRYTVLAPNLTGLDRAIEAGARSIAVFTAASDSFARHNINATVDESLRQFKPVIERARDEGLHVRGYVSTAFGCPYEGHVTPQRVAEVSARLFDLGANEVSLGDTIGVATPGSVCRVLTVLLDRFDATVLALHCHDTRGTALANVLAALELGIASIDSSAGGFGGCPYAPGASGNLATEDLLYMLHGMGIETGVDLDAVTAATRFLADQLGVAPPSQYVRATPGA